MIGAFDDVHALDPVSYIRGIGLRPEDSYGFLPVEHTEVTPYFFLYRDTPDYAAARAVLAPATDAQTMRGAIQLDPEQEHMLNMERDLIGGSDGRMAGKIDDAMKLAESFGAQPLSQWDPNAAAAAAPDPARLERLSNLLSSGAIDEQEYMRLLNQGASAPAPAPPPSAAIADIPDRDDPAPAPTKVSVPDVGTIVAHRIYPGLRSRVSTRQLDHFAPRYLKALSLRSEDVYGVIPRSTRMSSSSGDGAGTLEWDDYWIIYRDRPEYEEGRAAWADKMGKKWPDAAVSPGEAEPPAVPFNGGKVKVEKDLWPREKLVMRKSGAELGDAIRKKIGKWGYGPEDSLGFCPSFPNESIYFAWRKS